MSQYPPYLADRVMSNEDALQETVKPGYTIASGFATSEPLTFYEGLWDYITENDLSDLEIRQALFMGPHKICVGDALSAKGVLGSGAGFLKKAPLLGPPLGKLDAATQKFKGLGLLINHYKELQRRKIKFTSAFIGPATNIAIPDNIITRYLYPDFAGRNTTRMGITNMHSIHFPDAVNSMGYDSDGTPLIDTFVMVMTPPNEDGEMSHGPANGANAELLDMVCQRKDMNVLLYINPKYPFTRGRNEAPNSINVKELEGLAKAGRLFVVEDEGRIPALPADSFKNPPEKELAIADNIVNHIEMNKQYTYGRPIQVGIGGTGVLAIKNLKNSGWHGRSYTEMLEPFTLDLFEAGKIAGSHFVEKDGTRTQLDGKIVCTFTICEENSDFYKRLDNNPAIILSTASRVVIPEGFQYGMGINNILSIDFQGHVNAGGRDQNHYSGIGGSAMILRGLARGGVAYLCLKSVHNTPEGKLRSSIFPFMAQGTPFSHVGPDIWGGRDNARIFLVTEHGVARLSGKSQAEFIESVISVADPQFRDWLKKEAWKEFRVKV